MISITGPVETNGLDPFLPKLCPQKLSQFLWSMTARATFLAHEDFDRLPIRFRAVTTDLLTGRQVVLSEGELPTPRSAAEPSGRFRADENDEDASDEV